MRKLIKNYLIRRDLRRRIEFKEDDGNDAIGVAKNFR